MSSLALYLGMATLDNSSGKYRGSKAPKHVNTRAKAAMMVAVDHHRKRVPQSQRYYEKKRAYEHPAGIWKRKMRSFRTFRQGSIL